jgi:hypothetical protein
MWAVATLDGVKSQELAKTGDNDRFLLTVAKNEKSSGCVYDLT